MFNESFIRKLTPDHASALLQEREDDAAKCRRILPRLDWKMVTCPDWHATRPKSGCDLTLAILKEEWQEFLEESEEEVEQLEKHIGATGSHLNKQMELWV